MLNPALLQSKKRRNTFPVTHEMENLYYTVPADRIYVWVPTTKRQWENNRKNATLAFDEPLYDHGGKIACVPLGLHHQEYKNKTKKHIFSWTLLPSHPSSQFQNSSTFIHTMYCSSE